MADRPWDRGDFFAEIATPEISFQESFRTLTALGFLLYQSSLGGADGCDWGRATMNMVACGVQDIINHSLDEIEDALAHYILKNSTSKRDIKEAKDFLLSKSLEPETEAKRD